MRDSIFSITNVTAVLNDSLLEHATITIERGVIIDVAQFGPAAPDSINGSGSICIPGVVDSHSDGFEQELNPRPNATLSSGFALRSFESRVRAAGITTMFHGDALIGNRDKALPWLTEHAASGAINLMAHDPATSKDIAEAVKWSASIAEFPTTIEAAKLAKESGLRTVCGAPNVLRGKSHSGNVSAQELISKGLCDGLASDYLPTSLLGSAAALVERKVCSLPQAIRLITSGPAKTVGLNDRGEIAVGKRADLALIRLQGNLPTVFGVLTANSQHAERLSLVGASA
ncbi:MAG: hypothetical protein EBV58_01860 [Actinobacteria bacterium]|nr:hypothetical protein [Actinomycetota bacterium]